MPSDKLKFALSQKERENLNSLLNAIRNRAKRAWQQKNNFCLAMQKENNPCWGELRPYAAELTFWETIELKEFTNIMQRASPLPSEPRQRPEPDNASLYLEAVNALKKKRRAKPLTKP